MHKKILAIETSCDETGVSLLSFKSGKKAVTVTVLGNALATQTATHAPLGGVVPSLAKREHAKNLPVLLAEILKTSPRIQAIPKKTEEQIRKTLEREPGLTETFLNDVCKLIPPDIDAIVVTSGPGLEPALWVGINFARALGVLWNIPVLPINHMEGHVLVGLIEKKTIKSPLPAYSILHAPLPGLALLISGGHTELDLMKRLGKYQTIGETRDDAAGEAFDKVARMLELPYPGGPQISKLAEIARTEDPDQKERPFILPRPMLTSPDLDFSFAGLKTAVLYLLRDLQQKRPISEKEKQQLAREFENAVTEVLLQKTLRAVQKYNIKSVVLGGGVAANTHIRRTFGDYFSGELPSCQLYIPARELTTDNALMIGLAGFVRLSAKQSSKTVSKVPRAGSIRARGTWRLS